MGGVIMLNIYEKRKRSFNLKGRFHLYVNGLIDV